MSLLHKEPGDLCSTTSLKLNGVTTRLKPEYEHQVLLLETTPKGFNYTTVHAVDKLNSLGWVRFDDVAKALGKTAAKKVVAYVEKRNAKAAKELKKKQSKE